MFQQEGDAFKSSAMLLFALGECRNESYHSLSCLIGRDQDGENGATLSL